MADAVTTFRDGRLVLPMAHAVLQSKDPLPFCMEGSGEIRQTHEGVLTFQMHFKVDRSVVVGSLNPALGGPDLTPTSPCNLQLTGFGGERWTADDVWPDLSFDLEEHGIAKGVIRVLASQCAAPLGVAHPGIKYIVVGRLHYPANTAYTQTTTVGGRRVSSSESLAAATIESDSCKIELFPEGEHTAVTVTASHGADVQQLGARVLTSLQICLGQECRVLTEQVFSEPMFTQRLFSRLIPGPPHRWFPPVRIRSAGDARSAWQLFRNLLDFLEAHPLGKQNSIVHHHERLLMSSRSDIPTQLLHLAIAIEAIANARSEREPSGRHAFSQSRDAAIAAIGHQTCIPEAHRDRLCKALSGLSVQSNADAVRVFVLENGFDENYFREWKQIRNAAAHGLGLDGRPLESLEISRDRMVKLFYRLMADAVGYDGPLRQSPQPQ